MALLLVGQLLDQAVTLLSQGVELGFLSTKGGLGPTQLLPQFGVGRCRYGREEKSNNKEVVRKYPTRLLSSRPESRGLQPAGAPARPREEEELTSAFRQVGSPLAQLLNIAVEGSGAEVVILLQ